MFKTFSARKGVLHFAVVLVVVTLSFLLSSLLSSLSLAQEACNEKFRAANYETLQESQKCGQDCGETYYYEPEARKACWEGCTATRDASYKAAAKELDACLARNRGSQTQSPQPTEEALSEDTAADDSSENESIPNKPGFGMIQETFQWLGDIVEEISTTLPLAFIGTTMMFSTSEAAWEEAQLMLESFGLHPSSLSAQGESLKPVNLNEKPPEYTVEVTIDTVVIRHGPALIEVKSYNGEPGILRNGDTPTLEQGAIDVFVEPGSSEGFQIQTPDADFFVVLTKFSIIHSKKNSKTLLAVYEGEVKVKTKEGQTIRVSPNGNEPGLLVVGRKLSVPKLSVVVAVILVTAGAIIWFIRRKKKK